MLDQGSHQSSMRKALTPTQKVGLSDADNCEDSVRWK